MKKQKPRPVWVVEIKLCEEWFPCSSCGLDFIESKTRKKQMQRNNQFDKFRLRKYLPQED